MVIAMEILKALFIISIFQAITVFRSLKWGIRLKKVFKISIDKFIDISNRFHTHLFLYIISLMLVRPMFITIAVCVGVILFNELIAMFIIDRRYDIDEEQIKHYKRILNGKSYRF